MVKEERQFCQAVANRSASGAAQIGFPSDPLKNVFAPSGIIRDADITRVNGARFSSAAVLLCVNYKGAGDAHYQTQAWFGLYEDNNIAIPVGVDVSSNHLRLIREQNGDSAH
jgi:hypothetical protein